MRPGAARAAGSDVIPLLSTAAMREADARATATRGTDALVRAAGTAVGHEARRMLGRCYGTRVAVVAGPGLNGGDGRVAAGWLRARGARVDVIEARDAPASLAGYDLVIDAAFGLGCSRPYVAPSLSPATRVLAVDLPSGVDADTGALLGSPPRADVTLALGAVKFAHVTGPAARLIGELRYASLGIVGPHDDLVTDGVIEDADLDGVVRVARDDHKWRHALQVYAGSALMPGAGALVVLGALAGGASMVRVASRDGIAGDVALEAVRVSAGPVDPRCRAVVAGPGLGEGAASWLGPWLEGAPSPVVLDADALVGDLVGRARAAAHPWIVTPHDGEYARLAGASAGDDRVGAARALARDSGCVVLLKGPITVVADPDGRVRVVRAGTAALATAGSGDVLSGLIGATLARGHDALSAASLSAHLHGRAGARLPVYGAASGLGPAITAVLEDRGVTGAPRAAPGRRR